MDLGGAYAIGIVLAVVGIVLVVLAILLASKRGSKSRVRGAGVIIIGPIPIIFGSDKRSLKLALILALAFSIIVLLIYLMYHGVLR